MELGWPVAVEVRDRYGEAIVMLERVALPRERQRETRFSRLMGLD